MGLSGGALGFVLLGQSAVYLLVWPGEGSRLVSVPFFLLACFYLPAVWVSVHQSANRRRVLRRVVAVTLVFIVLGVFFQGPEFASLLLIPTTLLAIAAGLVWQGRG